MNKQIKNSSGVTLVELMTTILIAFIVILGIGIAMVDSIKSFPLMFERTTGNYQSDGGVIPDAYVAKAVFDRICRQASLQKPVGPYFSNSEITVYYYSDPQTAGTIDSSAKFVFANNQITVIYGDGLGNPTGRTEILAENVQSASFSVEGPSIIMTFTIDNTLDASERYKMRMTVTSTAIRHNE